MFHEGNNCDDSSTKFLLIPFAIDLYFECFDVNFALTAQIISEKFKEDNFNHLSSKINQIIQNKLNEDSDLNFGLVALLSGILNCTILSQYFIPKMCENFILVFSLVHKLCCIQMNNEFHIHRLLNNYLKLFIDYKDSIQSKRKDCFYNDIVMIFEQTIQIIDNNWESPINGVNSSVKQSFRYLIELWNIYASHHAPLHNLLIGQLRESLNLPYTCKSKYKKLSILMQAISNGNVDVNRINQDLKLPNDIFPCEIPFRYNSNFALQTIQHLSINSLSNSIAEFYKSSISSIVNCYQDECDSKITSLWSELWLSSVAEIFSTENTLLSSSTVVHNTLLAHILPVTIEWIPNSVNVLMKAFTDCTYGQVSVVRIFLEKINCESKHNLLPPPSWLTSLLSSSDDLSRAEGLALLIEEKFITKKDRLVICKFVKQFLLNNLNIDNAAFRQKIICKLEQFYKKLINSLSDRFDSETELEQMNSVDKGILEFIKDTFDILVLSLCPGSSFQRKFTSLSILGSLFELIHKEDTKLTIAHLLSKLSETNRLNSNKPQLSIMKMLLYGQIDKDDKIRRLSCEVLLQYSSSSISSITNDGNSIDRRIIQNVTIWFLKSFRHQECHIGGLLYKYIFCTNFKISNQENVIEPLELISDLIVNASNLFYSEKFRKNLLNSSITDSLHGWILALNQCLTFDSFFEGYISPISGSKTILFDEELKTRIFEPALRLSHDCLDFFLDLLSPVDGADIEVGNFENEDCLEEFSSPSFHQMCLSIKNVLQQGENFNENAEDIFLSNDFQLILSMCWLNIKENSFLQITLTLLFADLLSLAIKSECTPVDLSEKFLLMSPDDLYQIGMKNVALMLKCRHKGVIEACGVSLTKFTRTLLRIQFYLHSLKQLSSSIRQSYRNVLERFIEGILLIVDLTRQSSSTSVTRRSAGLALVVQSILIGEAEAMYLDGIKPLEAKNKTLYERIICSLISSASSPVNLSEEMLVNIQQIDIPQANALHILQSIIKTSALSHLSYKTVEQLFPLSIDGFTSPLWQIRNASLQLFGSCITRMLGQKKRTKNVEAEECGVTITFEEFCARYPTLLNVINSQFEINKTTLLSPMLVPILALLASFTPPTQTVPMSEYNKELVNHLVCLLSNKIWKIRDLAAKSLTNLFSLKDIEDFITNALLSPTLESNYTHGLLCCVSILFELKHNMVRDVEFIKNYRQHFFSRFEHHLNRNKLLVTLGDTIFRQQKAVQAELNGKHNDVLSQIDFSISTKNPFKLIKENISFRISDDVRLDAANNLYQIIVKLILNDKIDQLDTESIEYFFEIMICLFEDEERQVRFVSQKITASLNDSVGDKSGICCQNLSIQHFWNWLSQKPNWWPVLINKVILQIANFRIYLNERLNDSNLVLFEKEEKNVFAEPYLMSFRMFMFLEQISETKPDLIQNFLNQTDLDDFWNDLELACNFFQNKILVETKTLEEELLTQSIWRLPKTFGFTTNLYLTLFLIEKHSKCLNYKKTFDKIQEMFPILPVIRSILKNITFEHIL